jgi:hypothetical protein
MNIEIWQPPQTVTWSQILLDSYERYLGKSLIDRTGDRTAQAKTLFFAPFVVVSHGIQSDPVLNYGNQTALSLWEMTWDELICTPSRLTAEPINRQEREQMLDLAAKYGYIDNYRSVRISKSGRRFLMENAIVWNLSDEQGRACGQAATFSQWSLLPELG